MPPKYMPGEKRKRSLVTVEMDGLDASIFAPDKWEKHRATDTADTIIDQDYIVATRRFDGRWSHKIIIDGLEVNLPHKVFRALCRQVDAITRRRGQIVGRRKRRSEEQSWQRGPHKISWSPKVSTKTRSSRD